MLVHSVSITFQVLNAGSHMIAKARLYSCTSHVLFALGRREWLTNSEDLQAEIDRCKQLREEEELDNVAAPRNQLNLSGINLINNSLEVHRNSVAGAQTDTASVAEAGSEGVENVEPGLVENMDDGIEKDPGSRENTDSQFTNNSGDSD